MHTHRIHLLRALRRHRGEGGQAITEFAMVLPFLAIVVLIFVSFGKGIYYYIELTHSANEGARQAAVNQPSTGFAGLKQALCNEFGTGSELFKGSGTVSAANIAVSYPDTAKPVPPPTFGSRQDVGEPVKVDVSTHYSWFPFMHLGTFTITGSATMRIEQATGSNYTGSGKCS
jgi:Flp pilus assembly protein TadG